MTNDPPVPEAKPSCDCNLCRARTLALDPLECYFGIGTDQANLVRSAPGQPIYWYEQQTKKAHPDAGTRREKKVNRIAVSDSIIAAYVKALPKPPPPPPRQDTPAGNEAKGKGYHEWITRKAAIEANCPVSAGFILVAQAGWSQEC